MTRNWTWAPCTGGQSFDHWTTRKVPFFLPKIVFSANSSPHCASPPWVRGRMEHQLFALGGVPAHTLPTLTEAHLFRWSLHHLSTATHRICPHFLRLFELTAVPPPLPCPFALIFSDFKSELTLHIPWPHALFPGLTTSISGPPARGVTLRAFPSLLLSTVFPLAAYSLHPTQ